MLPSKKHLTDKVAEWCKGQHAWLWSWMQGCWGRFGSLYYQIRACCPVPQRRVMLRDLTAKPQSGSRAQWSHQAEWWSEVHDV